jgi:dTDP-glucose 4,6-dehydratase
MDNEGLFVDIDDTICRLPDDARAISPPDYAQAQPMPERIAIINSHYDRGERIVYWTARGTLSGVDWRAVTEEQLERWGCKYHELRMGKPAFRLFIDDKVINSERFFS